MELKQVCFNVDDTKDGKVEWRTLDLLEDVLKIELTSRNDKPLPPGQVLFYTPFGRYMHLGKLDNYGSLLGQYGYDLFTPSSLVNTTKVEKIVPSRHGNIAHFKDTDDYTVYISSNKTKDYSHLVDKEEGD